MSRTTFAFDLDSATVAVAPRGSSRRRSSVRHAIYRVPDLAFLPQRLVWQRPDGVAPPIAGELLLWRFRPEWQAISKDTAYTRLSKAELARVKNHPNRALGKRFAVGRAMLRGVLSEMLDCAPADVALSDDAHGQPVFIDAHRERIRMQVAYAGVWIVIGLATTPLGFGTRLPSPAHDEADGVDGPLAAAPLARTPLAQSIELRSRVRYASLLAATGEPLVDADTHALCQDTAACFVETGDASDAEGSTRWHILDVPMPGTIHTAVAVAQPVTRIQAFGWASPDGRIDAG
ncbi:4'-phosphopantetheinyl transferase family protein [Paraburkholderia sp.]|uniref:4'-phosphopantetheinyl transferase family protein n=1 Tax=Paraburkholderia sp. TaxID=1926495 RepID=UPI003D6F3318